MKNDEQDQDRRLEEGPPSDARDIYNPKARRYRTEYERFAWCGGGKMKKNMGLNEEVEEEQ